MVARITRIRVRETVPDSVIDKADDIEVIDLTPDDLIQRLRDGKVYVDYVQNGHGRLLVAPFSARPLPGAPVSMPLAWSEVMPKLDIRKFTIVNAPARMKKLKDDPLRAVLEEQPDLVSALEKLHARLG